MQNIKEILQDLCEISAVSGYEPTMQKFFVDFLNKKGIRPATDTIGNIILKKNGSGDKILMIVAHYDEIGFSIKYIDDNGYIYLSPIGGIDISIMRGQKVNIHHDGNIICGVIGTLPIHMKVGQGNNNKPIEYSDIWVDVGMAEEHIRDFVSIGDPVSYVPNFTTLAEDIVASKSLDNRAGVAALFSLYNSVKDKEITNYKTIYFVASAQEEVGLRGVQIAGYNINPNISIAIDATHATDYPSVNKKKYGEVKLGEGAVIPIGSNFDYSLQSRLKELALGNEIKFQADAIPCNSGTDISAVQLIRGGCSSGLISIPCRYMHTPYEVMSIKDISAAINIILQIIN